MALVEEPALEPAGDLAFVPYQLLLAHLLFIVGPFPKSKAPLLVVFFFLLLLEVGGILGLTRGAIDLDIHCSYAQGLVGRQNNGVARRRLIRQRTQEEIEGARGRAQG